MEHFYTLQGEGQHTGKAAYFIRLGGCDVGCVWCDVKESWDAANHPKYTAHALVAHASQHPSRIAVITGGEPTMYDLNPLTNTLQKAGFAVHIETSGAYNIQGNVDWVTLSPKKFKAPIGETLAKANELKVIVYNKSDFLWAEQYASQVPDTCRLYLQPEWSKHDEITPQIIAYIQNHPIWQLSLQTHKYINIP